MRLSSLLAVLLCLVFYISAQQTQNFDSLLRESFHNAEVEIEAAVLAVPDSGELNARLSANLAVLKQEAKTQEDIGRLDEIKKLLEELKPDEKELEETISKIREEDGDADEEEEDDGTTTLIAEEDLTQLEPNNGELRQSEAEVTPYGAAPTVEVTTEAAPAEQQTLEYSSSSSVDTRPFVGVAEPEEEVLALYQTVDNVLTQHEVEVAAPVQNFDYADSLGYKETQEESEATLSVPVQLAAKTQAKRIQSEDSAATVDFAHESNEEFVGLLSVGNYDADDHVVQLYQ